MRRESRRKIGEARRKFLLAIEKGISSPRVAELRNNIKCYQRNAESYQRRMDECRKDHENAGHAPEEIEILLAGNWAYVQNSKDRDYYLNTVKECQEEADRVVKVMAMLKEWLTSSELHPFVIGDQCYYLKKGRRKYDFNARERTTLSRFIIRQRPPELSGLMHSEIEGFCFTVIATLRKIEVQFLKGEEVLKAYHHAVGGSSCMTGQGYEFNRLQLYKENPDKVFLAVCCFSDQKGLPLEEQREHTARCIVWLGDDGRVAIDRMYFGGGMYSARNVLTDKVREVIAKQLGPIFYHYDMATERDRNWRISLKKPQTEAWPYLDSMRLVERGEHNERPAVLSLA